MLLKVPGLVLSIGAAVALYGMSQGNLAHVDRSGQSCDIKGNISYNTGEKIYHLPAQEHYFETRISLEKGERWFCSESEARIAGWRKARK
jgi:hypothetical protein